MDEDSTTPLRKYVTIIRDKKDLKWVCNYGCKPDAFTGSYSRIRAHLIGVKPGERNPGIVVCTKVPKDVREIMKKEEEDARDLNGILRKRKASGPSASTSKGGNKQANETMVRNMFSMSARDDADSKIARFFYSCGISFNAARSPLWDDAVRSINEAPKGYKGPSSEKLRTLLDKEKTYVDNKLVMMKKEWPQYGVSIVSDGWSNIRNQSLVNVLAVCIAKPLFMTAVDASGDVKSAEYIADLLLKAIDEVGTYNVVQVLTDNAANCKAAGDIIMEKLPHIFWSGCMPHTLSLLMKDIAKSKSHSLEFAGKCYETVKYIVKYVRNHCSVLHLFRKFSYWEVINVKKTRFGHHYIVMRRIHKLKNSLLAMVLNDEWDQIQQGTRATQQAHTTFKEKIKDEQFWKDVKFVLSFTKPVCVTIRFCDPTKP